MVKAIVTIQRCWRGYKGRQRAAQLYIFFVTEKMEIIRGLCRCWKVMLALSAFAAGAFPAELLLSCDAFNP